MSETTIDGAWADVMDADYYLDRYFQRCGEVGCELAHPDLVIAASRVKSALRTMRGEGMGDMCDFSGGTWKRCECGRPGCFAWIHNHGNGYGHDAAFEGGRALPSDDEITLHRPK